MTAIVAAYGRLGQDPKPISTRTGTAMAAASLAVDVADPRGRDDAGGGPPLWLKVVAFGALAESLARHAKGDPLSVSGRLQVRRYDAGGATREEWQCIADSIVSARAARPRGGRKAKAGGGNGEGRARRPAPARQDPPPFDDGIPF